MADIFHEVDEEVRREQLKKLWNRYSNHAVAAAILLVAAVGGWRGYEWWEAKKAAETGAAFEAASALAEAGKHADAEAAFAKIAVNGTSGYRNLARLRLTRLRWLASGAHGTERWDAFIAPAGRPLPEIVASGSKLSWPAFRPLLWAAGPIQLRCLENLAGRGSRKGWWSQ